MAKSEANVRNLLAERPGPSTYFDDAFYDRLVEIARGWTEPGPMTDASLSEEVAGLLLRECRLLDDGRLEDWLDLFTGECAYWIPGRIPFQDPREEITWELHDRRRLEDRVARLRTGTAFSQIPPTRTLRNLGNIESWQVSDDEIRVRTNLVINTFRQGRHRAIPTMTGYVLRYSGDAGWLIEIKQVNLIDADHAQANNSFVL